MRYLFIILPFICSFHLSAQKNGQEIKLNNESKQIKPTLFADLGKTCSTPDGMAIDSIGNLFLAVTNLANFEEYGSRILTFDENEKPITWFDQLPLHPITKKVHPMGIEFGQDGNLYIADNQNFAGQLNQSRILRIVVQNGKPIKAEVIVEGLGFSNAIRLYKNHLYITDFMFEDRKESGIYSFNLEDFNNEKIVMDDQTRQKHSIGTFPVGIDGIALDEKGDLYAGHFYSGTITKFEFTDERKVKSRNIVFQSDSFNCADGMYYDKTRNAIFIANLSNNSVHQLDLNTKTLNLIWINGNNDGSTGLLDNPCETIIYKGNLIVANFDTFKGPKNLEVDNYNTISKFKL
jgi:sugar lactone lactonase YvrE